MTSLKQAARNSIILSAGKVIGILISTLTLSLITRYLGVNQFGNFSTVLAFGAVVVSINDFGLTWLVSREIAQGRKEIINAFTSLKLVATVLTIGLSLILLPLIGYPQIVQSGIGFVLIYIFFTSINNLQIGILQGESALDKTAYTDIFSRLINLAIILLVIQQNSGYYGVLLGLNLAGIATYLGNYYFLRQFALPAWRFGLQKLQPYHKEIALTALLTACSFLVYKSDTLILARLKPALDVGIYNAAYRILDVIMSVPSILVGALYPVLSQAQVNPNLTERARVHQIGFGSIAMIGALTAGSGIILAKPAIGLIAGTGFMNIATVSFLGHPYTSVEVLQTLSIFVFLAFLSAYFGALLILHKKQALCILANGLGLLISLIGNIYLIPSYSYLASAWLSVGTQLLIVVILGIAILHEKIEFGSLQDLAKVVLVLCVSVLIASHVANPILAFSLFLGLWLAGTWLMGGQGRITLQQTLSKLKP